MTKEEALRAFRTYKIWDLMDTFTTDELQEMIDAIMPQQEQPEVDLEKAYKSYIESRKDDLSGNAVTLNMKDLARHFYELGLNAKK